MYSFCESTESEIGAVMHATYPGNVSTNRALLFIGMDFETMIYLSVKPRLLIKNVDFSNRQDKSQQGIYIKVTASNALIIFDYY